MKRTAIALLLASVSSISIAAPEKQSGFPSASDEIPSISATDTYMDRNAESARTQASIAGPSAAQEWDPIRSDDTYMLRHLKSIETQPSIAFPSSSNEVN